MHSLQWWANVAGAENAPYIRRAQYIEFSTRVYAILSGEKAKPVSQSFLTEVSNLIIKKSYRHTPETKQHN